MNRGAAKRGPQVTNRGRSTDPSVALAWLIGAIVAAGFVVLFVVLTITGRAGFAWPGLLAVPLLVWLAQQQFTETHRRRYHRWPAGWQLFWTGSQERHEVAQAWTRKDADRTVELSRILGIGLLVLSGVATLVLLSAAA
jgi:hypothetical protein